MKNLKWLWVFTMGIVLFTVISCETSMTPMKVNETLPSLTKSKFIKQSSLEEILNSKKCTYLVRGRSYAAPLGITTKGDLKNGARGIDEWVELDKGNSYILLNYKWVRVDQSGATQLHLDFDTMSCNE